MRERGVIIASGLMAGGALGGVFGAALPPLPAWYSRGPGSRRRSTTNERRLADRVGGALRRPLSLSLVRFDPQGRRRNDHVLERTRRGDCRRAPRHRHALGRRRHEPVGHRPLHRRLLVLRRAASRSPTRTRRPRRCARAGGVSAKAPDRAAIDAYLAAVDVRGAIARVLAEARRLGGLRGDVPRRARPLLRGDVGPGDGDPRQGSRSRTSAACATLTGAPPEPSDPAAKRERVAELLATAGHPSSGDGPCSRPSTPGAASGSCPAKSIPALGDAFIARYDALAARNLVPHLPRELARVPRANIRFLPIEDAWFSGSMNYLGRARTADGSPEYEATYELNASLEISVPEFQQLVSHEVVPGHVTTFAYLQDLFVRGLAGVRGHGADDEHARRRALRGDRQQRDPDRARRHRGGRAAGRGPSDRRAARAAAGRREEPVVVPHVEGEGCPQAEVAAVLRRDYLVSAERADKLSGAWGRHPLLGRMYLPAYRAGHGAGRRAAARPPARDDPAGALRLPAASSTRHARRAPWTRLPLPEEVMEESQQKKLAILVGGGPAPGINSVIGAATIRCRPRGGRGDGHPRRLRVDHAGEHRARLAAHHRGRSAASTSAAARTSASRGRTPPGTRSTWRTR